MSFHRSQSMHWIDPSPKKLQTSVKNGENKYFTWDISFGGWFFVERKKPQNNCFFMPRKTISKGMYYDTKLIISVQSD